MKTQAYCVKCKATKDMANGVESVLKNGRNAVKGKCPDCGTGMFKILGGKTAPKTETAATASKGPAPFSGWTFFDK